MAGGGQRAEWWGGGGGGGGGESMDDRTDCAAGPRVGRGGGWGVERGESGSGPRIVIPLHYHLD